MHQRIDNYRDHLKIQHCTLMQLQPLTTLLSPLAVSATLQATRWIHSACTFSSNFLFQHPFTNHSNMACNSKLMICPSMLLISFCLIVFLIWSYFMLCQKPLRTSEVFSTVSINQSTKIQHGSKTFTIVTISMCKVTTVQLCELSHWHYV